MEATINYELISLLAIISALMVQIIPNMIQSIKEFPWVNTKTKIIVITFIVNITIGMLVTMLFVTFNPDIPTWQKLGYGLLAGMFNIFGVKLKYDKSDYPSLKETKNDEVKPKPIAKPVVEPKPIEKVIEKVIRPIKGVYGPYKKGNPDGIDFYVYSPYGDRNIDGVTKLHNGTDYGTYQKHLDVVAIYDAEIIASGYDDQTGAGNYIKYRFKLDEQYYVVSSFHLDSRNVSKGDIVKQGETIGTVGNTGNSKGIHLHHEIHKGYDYDRKNSFDFAELLFA